MSVLDSLARAYDRLPDAPVFGFSSEKISFCISLNEDGSVAHLVDLKDPSTRKPQARKMLVPSSFKRSGITPRPFFLWDNANYALGLGSIQGENDKRFLAFRQKHISLIENEIDEGLVTFRKFLENWSPPTIIEYIDTQHLQNTKVVFALEHERKSVFLHERERSISLWGEIRETWQAVEGKASNTAICMVTGKYSPIARTHPAIKGIPSKGGKDADSMVSFNLDAFTSYGHEQGDNAPVSEDVAFKYTTALNRFLEKGSGHRIQIGDASTVFWADASDMAAAELAEELFAGFFDADPAAEEVAMAKDIGIRLERIRKGEHLREVDSSLDEDIRFYVLGLAPNAARLSVRFHFEDSFGTLMRNYQNFIADMRIDPPPREGYPPLWRYLRQTAVLGKSENVPPNLSGEWMRAILAGTNYPLTLLSAVLMRIRADGDVNPLRAGILKAILVRNFNREAPVALDPDFDNKGYLLGRLFSTYEQVQTAALGAKVNTTIKDKFYGSASAQPRKVFALLESGSANHLSKVGKNSPGYRISLEKLIGSIMDRMRPDDDPFPASLSAEEQALFGLGYHHQRGEFFKKTTATADAGEAAA